jgi:predicted metal-dependent hydrolase
MTEKKNKLLDTTNTAQDLTTEEVLEFADSNLEWLIKELENNEGKAEVDASFALEYKQLRDKFKKVSEKLKLTKNN